jgi:hypothetical protein
MIREKTLLIGTREEILEYIKTVYNMINRDDLFNETYINNLEKTKFNCFNQSSTPDLQIPDTFTGFNAIHYFEAVRTNTEIGNEQPSFNFELKLIYVLVKSRDNTL